MRNVIGMKVDLVLKCKEVCFLCGTGVTQRDVGGEFMPGERYEMLSTAVTTCHTVP
jgi:hypothetical protein